MQYACLLILIYLTKNVRDIKPICETELIIIIIISITYDNDDK